MAHPTISHMKGWFTLQPPPKKKKHHSQSLQQMRMSWKFPTPSSAEVCVSMKPFTMKKRRRSIREPPNLQEKQWNIIHWGNLLGVCVCTSSFPTGFFCLVCLVEVFLSWVKYGESITRWWFQTLFGNFHPENWGDDPIWLYNIFEMG